jgi:DNA-binding transcriptional MerR regulator
MTVDELASRAGSTTRNVRALQTQGTLLPPLLKGRTAHYGDAHLERLRAVIDLQQQGFSIASIRILFDSLERGRTLAQLLAVSSPVDADGTGLRAGRSGRLLSVLPTTLLQDAG